MRHLGKITQLQVLLPIIFGVVGVAIFFLMTIQAGRVVEDKGRQEAFVQVRQLGSMAADLIQQRTRLQMEVLAYEGMPDTNLLNRQSNAAAQNFPGQIVVLAEESAQVLYTTFEPTTLDRIFPEMLKNRTKKQFTTTVANDGYLAVKHDMTFAQGNSVEGFFMMRESLLMAPYQTILSQMKFFTILGVLLLAGAGLLIGRYFAIQLNKITDVVLEAEQGNKPEPLSEIGARELGQLSAALNVLIQGPTAREKVRQEANTDALTGLLNRRGFIQAIDEKFSKGGSSAEMSAMFMDLDGFKPINDTYGHDVGDDVLKEVAKRLNECTREEDVICRLGGDEFVILFPGLKDRKVLEERADRVLAKINEPYWVEDTRVTMGVSIGISIGPEDGKTGEELLTAADEAMYSAKKTGKNQFTFYS